MGLGYEAKKVSNARASHRHRGHQGKQCYFCGVVGHIKAFCNKFCARVDHAWRQGRYYWNHGLNQVFIRRLIFTRILLDVQHQVVQDSDSAPIWHYLKKAMRWTTQERGTSTAVVPDI
ncbi:unnamed protein product [Microthlaspi erraticum]|nr:unnamed protein product [Microthlaspi erraticum]